MTKKIQVTGSAFSMSTNMQGESERVRVRIIKAPLVNQDDLRNVVFSRARAIVL